MDDDSCKTKVLTTGPVTSLRTNKNGKDLEVVKQFSRFVSKTIRKVSHITDDKKQGFHKVL